MIERTTDYRRIKRAVPEGGPLIVSDKVFYLVEVERGEDVGVIFLHPCDQDGLLMHVFMGDKCRGKRAGQAYKNAFDWIFTYTGHSIIRGRISDETKPALVMARYVGGKFDEVDCDSLRCYSVNKSDFEQQRVA